MSLLGYSKKWAEIGDGKLSYSDRPDSDAIAIIDIIESSISKIPNSRKIIIDSGREVFHFRALTNDDYSKWIDALISYKRLSEPKPEHNMDISQKSSEVLGYLEVSRLNLIECSALLSRSSQLGVFSEDDAAILSRLLDKIFENINFVRREGFLLLGPLRKISMSPSCMNSMITSAHLSSDDDEYYDANDVMVLNDSSSSEESLLYMSAEDQMYESGGADEGEGYSDDMANIFPVPLSDAGNLTMDLSSGGYFDNIKNVVVPLPVSALAFQAQLEKIPWLFRSSLPYGMCPITVSIASLFRKSIGKDSSSLSMPICLNEPVNLLQRMCQELEYSELLNIACHLTDSLHRMIFVAAFACSSYSYTLYRAERKPFNPLLGETFEYISDSKGNFGNNVPIIYYYF